MDDSATIKYPTFDFALLSTGVALTTGPGVYFNDGQKQPGTGYWAIRFTDTHGEDFLTQGIPAGATCAQVVAALEALPNNVIPAGQTLCSGPVTQLSGLEASAFTTTDSTMQRVNSNGGLSTYTIAYSLAFWEADAQTTASLGLGEVNEFVDSSVSTHFSSTGTILGVAQSNTLTLSGYIYRVHFFGNPGAIAEPQIELYLDGKRPSLAAPGSKVITKVWTDGQQGEDNDYFGNHCDGVTVSIDITATATFLCGLNAAEYTLLQACLGDSDFDTSNNLNVMNWDYGNMYYPHLIKLVRSTTVTTDGGYYAAIWFDTTWAGACASTAAGSPAASGVFRVLNRFRTADSTVSPLVETDTYEVYTTTGTFALTSNQSEATFGFGSRNIYTTNVTYDTAAAPTASHDGDISCEIGNNNANKMKYIFHCLNKSDIFTFLSWNQPLYNPPHINLYTAKRLYTKQYSHSSSARFSSFPNSVSTYPTNHKEMHYMTHVINTDMNTNWAASVVEDAQFYIYKFFPSEDSTYNYVAECSNRGICGSTGVCQCFSGYTNDDCSIQNSIAL